MLYLTTYLSAMKKIYISERVLCVSLESLLKVFTVIGCLLIKIKNTLNVLAAFLCDHTKHKSAVWQEQEWTVKHIKNFEVVLIVKEKAHTWTRNKQSVEEVATFA